MTDLRSPVRAQGAVTGSNQASVDAGIEILQRGGNAVDAAVATALACCVADTCNTGLGGYGGHMVIAPIDGPAISVDFNAWQPGRLNDADIAGSSGNNGPAASCIPNVVAGLARALSEAGTLRWEDVLAPAIRLAEHGVLMNNTTRHAFEDARGCDVIDACFRFETEGDEVRFRQPDLAGTLRSLAEHGPGWFYSNGQFGKLAEKAWRDANLAFTADDWRDAEASVVVAPAPVARVRDVTLALAPLGTSGSVSALATLAAGANILVSGEAETPNQLLRWAERIAGAWGYRMAQADGNDFDGVALDDWLRYALAAEPLSSLKPGNGHTCHLNAADGDGTLVALTLTHGPQWFGARWALPGSGVIMNAGMGLFSAAPAQRRDGRAYAVTNMAPTVASTAAGGRLAVGCPGGRRIPTNVGLTLSRRLFGGMPLTQAVNTGRLHAEHSRRVGLESARLPEGTSTVLESRFERVREEDWRHYFGPLTAIELSAAGDFHLGLDDREVRGYGRIASPR